MSPGERILKGGAPLPRRRVAAAVREADLEARETLAAAAEEAGRIRAEAEGAREALRAQAIEEGLQEGRARAAAVLARAAAERERLLASSEREVVSLALAVARNILGRELTERAAVAAELAARALAEARERREVVLSVHPADAAAIRADERALAARLFRAPLRIREDPGLPRGSAVVDTEAGRVDAGIDAQLERLARALEEALAP